MSQVLPLEGVKVLDLTTVIMGPFTTQVLGDFGADIIKIEDPNGDMTRDIGPSKTSKMSSMFLGVNRNKRSLVLNLKKPEAKAALWKLIEGADIIVHNIRPQKIAALGFDPDTVLSKNPKIIYVGLHGYREDGPYGGLPAFDDVIQGQSGIAGAFETRDGKASLVPTVMADKSVGLMASTGLLAAYIQRLKTGKGSYLEVSMFEGMVGYTLIEHHYGATFVPPLDQIGYPRALSPNRKPYQSADGYICILPYTNQQWINFFKIIKRPELLKDKRYSSVKERSKDINFLYEIVGQSIINKTNKEWTELLKKYEIPHGLVNRLEDLKDDPHLKELNFFRPYNHPTEGALEVPDSAFRFNRESLPVRRHQPKLGEHSNDILKEAGFKDDEIIKILNH
ncbi:MAG: CoA transferase [Pelagibacterales bacterium]|nr:CoA transferase [Pelagibacterales bacterium]